MKSFLALLAALAAVLLLSSCNSPASDGHTDHQDGADGTSTVETKPAEFNDADVAFATDMIPHHQQAVQMSALVPERSTNPQVIELAAAVAAAQGPEIETLKVFLVQWGGGEAHDGHDTGAMQMPGMVDEGTMTKLASLNGNEFDALWLTSMIAHHEGAIEMANTELADGANVDAKTLAQQIVTTQQAEIDQMRQMG